MKEVNDRSGPIWNLPKGVGKQNCLTIHAHYPIEKIFNDARSPPPPFNYIFLQGLPELELHEYACLSILKFVLDEKKVHDN